MSLYNVLLTPQYPKPEGLDIPKLYYSGPVLGNYNAIALAFTEDTKKIEIENEIVTKSQKPVQRVHFKDESKVHFLSTNIDELIEEEDELATRHRPFPQYAGHDKEESKIATRNRKKVRYTEMSAESSFNAKLEGSTKYPNLKGRISKLLLEAKSDFQLMKRKLKKRGSRKNTK